MTLSKPSIGAIVTITNPLSSGYYVYLASIASLCKALDRVVVIDGGSDDGSLEFLCEWAGQFSNMSILNDARTYWGRGQAFHFHQINASYDYALANIDCDWVFAMPADQVAWEWKLSQLRSMLISRSEALYLSFHRSKVVNGKVNRNFDQRGIAVNLTRCCEESCYLRWGDVRGASSDFPIRAYKKSTYLDPANRSLRYIFSGEPLTPQSVLDIRCGTYGYFFLSKEQIIERARRWDYAVARYYGWAPIRDLDLRLRKRLYNINGYIKREDVLQWDLAPEMKKVVAEYYVPGMYGGAVHRVSPALERVVLVFRKLLGVERRLRTLTLRARGYQGLQKQHAWVSIDAPDPDPLDVHAAYKRQDVYLSPRDRIVENG